MNSNWSFGYGIGFALFRKSDRTLVGHAGDAPGYDSMIAFVPESKLGIVILTNMDTKEWPRNTCEKSWIANSDF
ncbi:serine hydrolase [bacterium]|nr:serine hydrolase [bacterium]